MESVGNKLMSNCIEGPLNIKGCNKNVALQDVVLIDVIEQVSEVGFRGHAGHKAVLVAGKFVPDGRGYSLMENFLDHFSEGVDEGDGSYGVDASFVFAFLLQGYDVDSFELVGEVAVFKAAIDEVEVQLFECWAIFEDLEREEVNTRGPVFIHSADCLPEFHRADLLEGIARGESQLFEIADGLSGSV